MSKRKRAESKGENMQPKKKKPTKPPPKGKRLEKMPSYFFEHNGYRFVAPYKFEYRAFAKGRWFGREILDVFTKEFLAYDAEYYRQAILDGRITIRDEPVALDYIIKNNDWVCHTVHRHEPPVVGGDIEILQETEDMIIINKPSSIPVHPCGKYRYNSLVYILKQQLEREVFSCHRLDRVTSGLMLFCKTKEQARVMGELISSQQVQKTYLARVKGEFPADTRVEVNQPLYCEDKRYGKYIVHPDGKQSLTHFERVSYNGRTSVVRCFPKTGRTHQIRVHLQFTGHPIVNDDCYGGSPGAGLNALADPEGKLRAIWEKHRFKGCAECVKSFEELSKQQPETYRAPFIWLHALRYETPEHTYESPEPPWAKADFTGDISFMKE